METAGAVGALLAEVTGRPCRERLKERPLKNNKVSLAWSRQRAATTFWGWTSSRLPEPNTPALTKSPPTTILQLFVERGGGGKRDDGTIDLDSHSTKQQPDCTSSGHALVSKE